MQNIDVMGNTRSPELDPIRDAVSAAIKPYGSQRVVVACSGGPDSLVLADAALWGATSPAHVYVVSIDHGLGPHSAEVAAGVARWAKLQGALGIVRSVTVAAGPSLEAAARAARYAALAKFTSESGAAVILTGHSASDQAETVLMRILRGTGPTGLAGIPTRRMLGGAVPIVRPLLAFTRAEVLAYSAARGLCPWSDPMNRDLDIQRVRVRTQVLPALRAENPRLDEALLRLAESAAEWAEVIDDLARPLAMFPLDCRTLTQHKAAVRKRAIMIALDAAGIEVGTVHLEAIDDLVRRAPAGETRIDVPGAQLVRSYDALDLRRPRQLPTARPDLVAPPGPYVLRGLQPGDRMRPARLKGRSKKLSDLYIDTKVPRSVRATARVLARTTTGAIVWAEHLGLAHAELENLVPTTKKLPE